MIDLDEVMGRKDMRTVTAAETKCLIAEIQRLRESVREMFDAFQQYEMDVEDPAPPRHLEMMERDND